MNIVSKVLDHLNVLVHFLTCSEPNVIIIFSHIEVDHGQGKTLLFKIKITKTLQNQGKY